MGIKKISTSGSKMPAVKKKSILQQVMKPKDWVAIGILVVVSAFCWVWVLSTYQESINIDDFASGKTVSLSIDKSPIL
ncbi:MAG: hypothetical protein Q7K65_04605 [Candidatus Buchananbacteria bacterium]|nr:hypothetical protein [Candidatus Buchananbacteria bacterium]